MGTELNDPRLVEPQCHNLTPVETVHENPWFSVRNRGGYYTIEYNTQQVLVLPVVEDREFVMVRVHRPVVAEETLELPAGGIHAGEAPVRAAARELSEETGIIVDDIGRFVMLPPLIHMPRSPLLPYVFQVSLQEREVLGRNDHDDEIESVECFTFEETLAKIASGEIHVGLHIGLIMRFLLRNRKIRLLRAGG